MAVDKSKIIIDGEVANEHAQELLNIKSDLDGNVDEIIGYRPSNFSNLVGKVDRNMSDFITQHKKYNKQAALSMGLLSEILDKIVKEITEIDDKLAAETNKDT